MSVAEYAFSLNDTPSADELVEPEGTSMRLGSNEAIAVPPSVLTRPGLPLL